MQIIYGKEFDDVEFRKSYTPLVYKNLLRSMVAIYEVRWWAVLPCTSAVYQYECSVIMRVQCNQVYKLPGSFATHPDFWQYTFFENGVCVC